MKRLLYFLCLCVFTFSKTSAQTYLVTSNSDSGPGTLRQGLLNAAVANRTTQYVINFQLPGNPNDHANRTIRLRTALPIVSSNVVIDGSSQSWPALGVSGAKIILEPEYTNTTFSGLVIGQLSTLNEQTIGVEIYGLYIRNFATINNLQNVSLSQGSGIVLDYRANNVKIGAPGKGNVIGGNISGISIQNNYFYTTANPLSRITIQSNLIGVIYDGITANTNVYGISGSLYECSLDVGGDNSGESNVIAANRINLDIKRSYTNSTRFDINIINNKIGVDYTGSKDFHELPLFLSSSSLEIAGLKVDATNAALYIRNNIIGGNRTVGVSIANSDFIMTGNAIGTDAAGNVNLGNGIGVKVETGAGGVIGGADGLEKNIIANNNFGIETVSAKPVKITRNSMYCNRTFGIGKTLAILQPTVQILKERANFVSGKASPNSEIELFYTENCQGICEGKTYVATVQAGSDGRWEYSGALSRKVTATASLLNATTSPFSTAKLLPNEAIVRPVTCSANGSVTIPEEREGFTFSWVKIENDGTRVPKGNTQSVSGLEVGTYEVTIDDGCKAFPNVFIIRDQKLTKPTILAPTPACGQMSFSFQAEILRGSGNFIYQWKNSADVTVATGNPVSLPEGTYYVKVTDGANCTLDSDPITIRRRPQPKIISTNMVRIGASCGIPNGSIKGLRIDDATGSLTYKWYLHNPTTGQVGTTVVATTIDLENVEGGTYSLFVTDEGSCSPVSQVFTIGVTNIITISDALITPGRCGLNNGILDRVTMTNADKFEWVNASNAQIIKSGAYTTGMQLRIDELAPGVYTLRASNAAATCTFTKNFIVPTQVPLVYVFTPTVVNTTCELDNGSITLNYTSLRPTRFEWRNEQGNIYTGTVTEVKNLPVGTYRLFAYDVNNCETVLGPYTINAIPKLVIQPNSGTIVKDGCGLKRGSIKGVVISGGVPNYSFKWIDASGQTVQTTQDLINVGYGSYRLEVKDLSTCGYAISQVYTVDNVDFPVLPPVVNDMRVCYVSDIKLPIVGPEEGTYQLFLDEYGAGVPLYETTNGVFNFKVSKTADYYIRRKIGHCISELSKVHIEVTHDNLEIGNVITPNGDGMNDTWMLKGLPDYKGNNVKVYNRSGQLIYESIGNYTKPFDGRFRGKELPAGTYFYVIDLRAECNLISGSITLLR